MVVASSKRISGIRILMVLILSAGTVLLFNTVDRYKFSGNELLVNNNFHQKLRGWQDVGAGAAVVSDGQSIVRLTSDDDHKTVAIKQWITGFKKDQPVRFSGAIKTKGEKWTGKEWRVARLILVGFNSGGKPMYKVPHVLVARHRTEDWGYFSRVFTPGDNVAELQVEIQLRKVKGSMWVKDLSLRPVSENPVYRMYWIGDVVLWAVVMFWALVPYRYTVISSAWNVLIIIMFGGVLFGALMPAGLKNNAGSMVQAIFPWISDTGSLFRVGHFLSFTLLSLVVFWKAISWRDAFERFGLLILFAMVTEVLQLLVVGRNARVEDFLTDVAGVSVALAISVMWLTRTGSWSARV